MYPLDRTILLGPSLEVHDFVEVLDVTTQLTKVDQSFYPSEMLDDSQVGCWLPWKVLALTLDSTVQSWTSPSALPGVF